MSDDSTTPSASNLFHGPHKTSRRIKLDVCFYCHDLFNSRHCFHRLFLSICLDQHQERMHGICFTVNARLYLLRPHNKAAIFLLWNILKRKIYHYLWAQASIISTTFTLKKLEPNESIFV